MTDAFLTQHLEAIPIPALLVGRGERILAANKMAQTMFGDQIVGRPFVTAIRQPSVLDAVEACFCDQTPRKTRYLANDAGRDMTYDVTAAHVNPGDAAAVLVCFQDITPMEQAGQMRRDFVANVSHELRTPLTSVLGFIETLRGPARSDPKAQERFLTIMASEAQRMERLVHDLLSLSRVESEERIRPTDQVDLVGIVKSVLHTLGPQAQERDTRLIYSGPDGPVKVFASEDQLRQVFVNLVENAIKYGRKGGQVSVTLTEVDQDRSMRGPSVHVAVRDDGAGIDPAHLPRLTERFYRIDSHRSREMGGTGLGLAIVKHIVNRHRGRLRVESTQGQGSTFTIILPRHLGT
jgi:two-component system phosphate regulon sensor histidine kinase PhoR